MSETKNKISVFKNNLGDILVHPSTFFIAAVMLVFQLGSITIHSIYYSKQVDVEQHTGASGGAATLGLVAWIVGISLVIAGLWILYKKFSLNTPKLLKDILRSFLLLYLLYIWFGILGVAVGLVFISIYRFYSDIYWILHNLLGVSLGILAVLTIASLIGPLPIVLGMFLILVWDFVAVERSNVMSEIFDFSLSGDLPNYLVVPSFKRLEIKFSEIKNSIKQESDEKPEGVGLYIGVGDFVFPSLLVVSSFISGGLSLGVAGGIVGSILSIPFLLVLLRYTEGGLPGLPVLNTGCFCGWILGVLVSSISISSLLV